MKRYRKWMVCAGGGGVLPENILGCLKFFTSKLSAHKNWAQPYSSKMDSTFHVQLEHVCAK